MINITEAPFEERLLEANKLLNVFSEYTTYLHGDNNPYLKWLQSNPAISKKSAILFLSYWYSVSLHQPQILLLCTSAFPSHADRTLMMKNYLEEDGIGNELLMPHYDLLEQLIIKLGGSLVLDENAENLNINLYKMLSNMSPAQACGAVAGIEHIALDVSFYLNKIIELCGSPELKKTDLYLTIHVDVEPDHIIWSHGNAMKYMQLNSKNESEVLEYFKKVMSFWEFFFPNAFKLLGYN